MLPLLEHVARDAKCATSLLTALCDGRFLFPFDAGHLQLARDEEPRERGLLVDRECDEVPDCVAQVGFIVRMLDDANH